MRIIFPETGSTPAVKGSDSGISSSGTVFDEPE
jgi:hypothetical protein